MEIKVTGHIFLLNLIAKRRTRYKNMSIEADSSNNNASGEDFYRPYLSR